MHNIHCNVTFQVKMILIESRFLNLFFQKTKKLFQIPLEKIQLEKVLIL